MNERSEIRPDWVAVDWGTSNLRAWAMGPEGVLAEAASDDGMGKLSREGFEPALVRLIGPWLAGQPPVIACGMVGSRQGWCEAPYRTVPCTPLDPSALVSAPTLDPRLRVSIAPGLKQTTPADVMRGEETQIAGALTLMPGYDGILCLPGTHTKWAHVSAGEVVSFQTCMTGELFALLSQASVLRHGMQGEGWDDAAFDAAVGDAIARPERLAARLFALRAEGLVAGLAPAAARARLSGLLIGVELAATRGYWLGQRVTLIGAAGLSAAYARALSAQGVEARGLAASDCTLAGLASLAQQTEAAG
jgi:2-dehydro-3-deoxygalactonokinase